jgi:ABC-type transport system involved in multi-copper enzyme maturation permease subunit
MDSLKTLMRLTRIEALKFWRKPIAIVVIVLMLAGPIIGEVLIARLSPRDAVYPRVTQLLFTADMLVFIALATVVLSVLALGNDYELGTLRGIISRGVSRHQFILSKIIATALAALVYGFIFMAAGVVSSLVAHLSLSNVPFFEAAGRDIILRALGATGVIGLVNFVLSAIVMLALILGRSSWIGMLAGLGYFFVDFTVGGIGTGSLLGVGDAYRYTVSYQAISIMERFFPSDPSISLPRAWIEQGFTSPGSAMIVLFFYGAMLTVVSVLIFQRQDLMAKR